MRVNTCEGSEINLVVKFAWQINITSDIWNHVLTVYNLYIELLGLSALCWRAL